MTGVKVVHVVDPSDAYMPAFDYFAGYGVLECRSERVLADDAKDYRSAFIREPIGRPLYELYEVVKKSRLDPIFAMRQRIGIGDRRAARQRRRRDNANSQSSHDREMFS